MMETKQIISWLLDKADRVEDQSADRIMRQAAERLRELDQEQKWIPVTERLPEMHTKVLCCGIRGGRFIAELSTWGNGNLYWDKRNGKGCPEVTHWMPLPEPPKGE